MKAITVYRSADNSREVQSSAEALEAAEAQPSNMALREWREVLLIQEESNA